MLLSYLDICILAACHHLQWGYQLKEFHCVMKICMPKTEKRAEKATPVTCSAVVVRFFIVEENQKEFLWFKYVQRCKQEYGCLEAQFLSSLGKQGYCLSTESTGFFKTDLAPLLASLLNRNNLQPNFD